MESHHPVIVTSKRRKWLIVLACLALAISLAVVFTRDREPRYEGRTLSEWMGKLLPITSQSSAPDPNGSRAAIRAIGTNAIPHLLEFLVTENETSGFRNSTKLLLDRSPVSLRTRLASLDRWARMDIDDIRRAQVPMAFEALGTAAVSAIPRLEKLTQDRSNTNLFWYATWSLAAISTNAQPILLAGLSGTNSFQRNYAAVAYAWYSMPRSNAEPAVPFLIEILGDTNGPFFSRETAARALGEIGTPSEIIVPALVTALTDPHSSVRQAVTNALQKIAPEVLTNAPPQ